MSNSRRTTANSVASFQTVESTPAVPNSRRTTANSSIVSTGSCAKFGTLRTKNLKPELCKWRKHMVAWHGQAAATAAATTLGSVVSADVVYPRAVLETLGIEVDPVAEAAIKQAFDDTHVPAGADVRAILRRATCAMGMAIVQHVHDACANDSLYGTADSAAFDVSRDTQLTLCTDKLKDFMRQQNTPMGFSKWLPYFFWRTAAVKDADAVRTRVLQSNLMTNILSVFLAANQAGVDVDAVVAQGVQRNVTDRLTGIARTLSMFFIDKAPYIMQWRIVDDGICRTINNGIADVFNYFNVGYLERQACDDMIATKRALLEKKSKWAPKTPKLAAQHMADVQRLNADIDMLRAVKQAIETFQRLHPGDTGLPAHLRQLYQQDPDQSKVVEALRKQADAKITKEYISTSKCVSALQMLGTEDTQLLRYVVRRTDSAPLRGGGGEDIGVSMEAVADLVAGGIDVASLHIAYARAVFAANCMVLFGDMSQQGGDGDGGNRNVGPVLGKEIQDCVHMVAMDQLDTSTEAEHEVRSLILDAMSGANAVQAKLKSQYDKVLAWMRGAGRGNASNARSPPQAHVREAFRPMTTHTLCLIYNILCAVKYHGLAEQLYAVFRTFVRIALDPAVRYCMTFAYAGGAQWWRDIPAKLLSQIAPEMTNMPKNDRNAWFAEFHRRWNDSAYMIRVWKRFNRIIMERPEQGKVLLKATIRGVFTSSSLTAFLATVGMDNISVEFGNGCDAFVDAVVDINPGIIQLILTALDKEIEQQQLPSLASQQSGGGGAMMEEALVRACATAAAYVHGTTNATEAARAYRCVNVASMLATGVQLMDATDVMQTYEAGIVALCRQIVDASAASQVPSEMKSGLGGIRSVPLSSHVPSIAVPAYGGGSSGSSGRRKALKATPKKKP